MDEMTPNQLLDGFGQRVRTARRMRKMSQEKLAEEIGISQAAVSQWESPTSKKITPAPVHLVQLKRALRVSIDWLLTGDTDGLNQSTFEEIRSVLMPKSGHKSDGIAP